MKLRDCTEPEVGITKEPEVGITKEPEVGITKEPEVGTVQTCVTKGASGCN